MYYDKITIHKVCQISIVDYLASVGIMPVKTVGSQLLYRIREENTPSCYVHPEKNVFNDFGSDRGSIIRLVQNLYQCDFGRAMEILLHFHHHLGLSTEEREDIAQIEMPCGYVNKKRIIINKVKALENKALIQYLESRKINLELAKIYLQEAYYTIQFNDKQYFALAFKNDLGGYELRNKYFKGCNIKGVTFISNISKEDMRAFIVIFEGFMDFLSFLTVKRNVTPLFDFLILNGVCNKEASLDIVSKYSCIGLCIDNDEAGNDTADFYKKIYPQAKFYDFFKSMYPRHKDLNEYLIDTK